MDPFHNWFMSAYRVILNSSNDSGRIPLSELKVFQEEFGIIGSFKEFATIMYAIHDTYDEFRLNEEKKELQKLG